MAPVESPSREISKCSTSKPGLAEIFSHKSADGRYKSVGRTRRSEEHTSELQSHSDLVCRLLLDPATTELYTLSLHDALPIYLLQHRWNRTVETRRRLREKTDGARGVSFPRNF